jgi:hypothetical protein
MPDSRAALLVGEPGVCEVVALRVILGDVVKLPLVPVRAAPASIAAALQVQRAMSPDPRLASY